MKGDRLRTSLNCGISIPCIGFGTYSNPYDGCVTETAILNALKVGYRHFDTAMVYGSEPAVGSALKQAMREGKVEREETFVTSKLWGCDFHDPVSALKRSLKMLHMEYIDMYLVHWPLKLKPWVQSAFPKDDEFEAETDMEATWAGMERCMEIGLCRGIGVSNFSSKKIAELVEHASVIPAVNQVEMHPMWRQKKLREACAESNIHVSAYTSLGGPGNTWGTTAVMEHPTIRTIALRHNVTPAQVALQWGVTVGASVIVKSFNEKRMEENFAALNFKLEDRDMLEIDTIEERKVIRAGIYVGRATGPYKTLEELWDNEI
ncbi:hypothetical protein MLD38_029090 [Melastoma candidum]|uniref:Uncharacterized protein n=1 Tax=Melastoma candidum TaxID=119954 RepID=A0ACB9N8L3_9MYRT|nr:hypothetical protein MLD38_029090 [Melastoma candidum]